MHNSPISLHSFFPGLPKSINAAFVLGKAIYFISSGTYYKVVIKHGKVRRAYRTVPPFKHSPTEINAVLVWPHYNIMYAFSRNNYYVADIRHKQVSMHSLYNNSHIYYTYIYIIYYLNLNDLLFNILLLYKRDKYNICKLI